MKDYNYMLEARSKKDGIVFYSKKCPMLGLEAFYDENEKIQTQIILTELDDFNTGFATLYSDNSKKITNTHLLIINAFVIILSFILGILFKNLGFFFSGFIFLIVSDRLLNFINTCYSVKSKNSSDYAIGKFHSAEHMVCNAYEKLRKIPTLDEIQKFSRFHKRCGSNDSISNFFFYIASIISYPFAFLELKYLLILFTIILIHVLNKKFNWLCFLQIMITNKATKKELLLAIKGLEGFEAMEDLIQEDLDKIILSPPHDLYNPFCSTKKSN